jgi:hypothetical protein
MVAPIWLEFLRKTITYLSLKKNFAQSKVLAKILAFKGYKVPNLVYRGKIKNRAVK